jgi:uncharacterized protein involved in exopolysaccharide biosynthesis
MILALGIVAGVAVGAGAVFLWLRNAPPHLPW